MSISIELQQRDISELTMERWATVGPDGLWSTSDGAVSISMNIEAAKLIMQQIERQFHEEDAREAEARRAYIAKRDDEIRSWMKF